MKLCLLLCVVLALAVPALADAARFEVQHPEERIYVVLPPEAGWSIVAVLYPKRNVAVIYAEKGEPEGRGGRWMGTGYAIHPSSRFSRRHVNVDFGALGRIKGRITSPGPTGGGRHSPFCKGPQPVAESGEFKGSMVFAGDGGYVEAEGREVPAFVERSFALRCKKGHADKFKNFIPGLFGYIAPPTRTFSNGDGTRLSSSMAGAGRVTEFVALHHLFEHSSTFEAAALEWLPGDVAATRWVEASRVAWSNFTIGQPDLHPQTATVDPPPPFSGEATYSRDTRTLTGDLTASFPGLELPLAGDQSEASICVFTRRMLNRVCDEPSASVAVE